MSEQPRPVPGFIRVSLIDCPAVYVNPTMISMLWKRQGGDGTCVFIGENEEPYFANETIEEIAELLRQAMGASGHD